MTNENIIQALPGVDAEQQQVFDEKDESEKFSKAEEARTQYFCQGTTFCPQLVMV